MPSVALLIVALWGWAMAAQAVESQGSWQQLMTKAGAAAQTEWAERYEHGEGVQRDYAKAITLYCAAARRGYAPAQYQLGWLYANGRGVERDDALAAAWFRLAAAKGDAHARRMLAQVDDPKRRKQAQCVYPAGDALLAEGEPSPARQRIEAWVRDLAPDYGLDPRLVLAVIRAESNFNANARSPKNAQGLMQLIPDTAARFGVRNSLDPLQNLHGGMAYLRWLLAYFQGDVRLALAGYNAGEKAVERYRGIPPYAETRAYVAAIVRAYGQVSHPPVEPVVAPSTLAVSFDLDAGQ
ncbi:MAG: transglycosylase SLT domain-containing protein [Pseudomonadota bacterium]|nr:transglycosylase SLT domain-containing protein [Pseudomonadota bacterium]